MATTEEKHIINKKAVNGEDLRKFRDLTVSALGSKQDKKLVVNIVINGMNVTADKTLDEIKTAYREGKDIELLENNGYVYHLISASLDGEYLGFEHYIKYEHKVTSIVLALSHWELTERYLQERLTFDTTPTANSGNPVTSGGIKTALNEKQPKRLLVTVTMDNTITADKSYQEIETAFQYGSEIVVFDGSYTYYHLISYDAGDFYFKATSYDEPDCDYYLRLSEMEGWSLDAWPVQRQLVSGRDIKTINNKSVLASGNMDLSPYMEYANESELLADTTQRNGTIGFEYSTQKFFIYHATFQEWLPLAQGRAASSTFFEYAFDLVFTQ